MQPNNTPQPPQQPNQTPATPPQTTETHDYLHPIYETPKHTYHLKRVKIILGTIVGVSILAVVLMILYALLPAQQRTNTTNTNKTSTASTDSTLTAKEAIADVSTYFKGTEKAKHAISRAVKAPGKAFYTVIPETDSLVSVAGNVTAEKADAQLSSILKAMDYDKFSKTVTSDGANNTTYLADLTRDDIICQVEVTKSTDTKADQWIEVRCLDMTTYTAYANAQETFTALYTPLTASSVEHGFTGKATTKASATANYTLAQIPVSTVIDNRVTSTNRVALYYQSPDKLWRYFTDKDTNILVECEQYSTTALKTAYAGESCRRVKTGTTESVVAPKTKK